MFHLLYRLCVHVFFSGNYTLEGFQNAPLIDQEEWKTKQTQEKLKSKTKLPVIVFSHGILSSRNTYSTFCTQLASEGNVVVAIEHRLDLVCLICLTHLRQFSHHSSYGMLRAVWYLYNLKNVKNTHGGVLLSIKLACNFTKSNTPPWVFSRFLNCTNSTKSRKASHM